MPLPSIPDEWGDRDPKGLFVRVFDVSFQLVASSCGGMDVAALAVPVEEVVPQAYDARARVLVGQHWTPLLVQALPLLIQCTRMSHLWAREISHASPQPLDVQAVVWQHSPLFLDLCSLSA